MVDTTPIDGLDALAGRIGRVVRHPARRARHVARRPRARVRAVADDPERGSRAAPGTRRSRRCGGSRARCGCRSARCSPRTRRRASGGSRRDEREALRAQSGMDAWLVHADGREHRSEVYELRFAAGVDAALEPHLPGTEELIHCVSGRLRAGPVGEQADLGPGDAVWFAADVPHAYTRRARHARAVLDALPDGGGAAVTPPARAPARCSRSSPGARVARRLRQHVRARARRAARRRRGRGGGGSGLVALCLTMGVVAIALAYATGSRSSSRGRPPARRC